MCPGGPLQVLTRNHFFQSERPERSSLELELVSQYRRNIIQEVSMKHIGHNQGYMVFDGFTETDYIYLIRQMILYV